MKNVSECQKVARPPITAEPDVLGGEPVFAGTRVPVKTLFEHLEANCTLDEFLEWFPTASREAAVEVLMAAHELTIQKHIDLVQTALDRLQPGEFLELAIPKKLAN